MMQADTREKAVPGVHGRDAGRTYYATEIDPLTMAGYVLRLIAALRVPSYEDLLLRLQAASEGAVPIDAIMHLLQGADPQAVHALIRELLTHVRVSPDPQHPGVKRPLLADGTDIRELRTLGDVLMGAVKLNFDIGGW